MKRLLLACTFTLLSVALSFAQSVQQSGTVTQGHAARWITNGVIGDAGTAASGTLTSLGVTASGSGICQNSAAITSAGYQQLCMGVTTAGGGYIALQNYGTATAQGLSFIINGTPVTLPTGGGTFITGTAPFSVGGVPAFSTTGGVIVDSGVKASGGIVTTGQWAGTTLPISVGGTGATTASAARTNLGLGTIATQDSSAVEITGGTITGMPNPSANTDVANKQYVDATSSGLHILTASVYATTGVLPQSPTYANGASGVGATLTAGSNAALVVDSATVSSSQRILVKNQAAPAQNGIYTVTTVGDGSTPWVLTRATDFDTSAEMLAGSYTLITSGTVNIGASYILVATVATVGSSAVTFTQFSQGFTAGGSTTQVQFNSGGGLAGSANLTWVSPALTIGATGSATGQLVLKGTTSGAVTFQTQAAAGTWNFNPPITAGTSGQHLTSAGGGSSPMTWATVRTVLTATLNLYVDNSLGNDANDCTAAGASACRTYQAAINKACANYDAAQQSIIVQGTTGQTYSEHLLLCNITGGATDYAVGKNPVLRGDPSLNPANVTLSCGASQCVTGVNATSGWIIDYFTLTGTSDCIYADNKSIMFVRNVVSGCTGSDLLSYYGSTLETIGPWTSTNNKSFVFGAVYGGIVISAGELTLNANTTGYLAISSNNSLISLVNSAYHGSTAQTLFCLSADTGGGINRFGATLPCTAAQTATSPGWIQ